MINKRKHLRALVLPGGGSRGAYQVGAAMALLDRNIQFDYILGTSIGALNATLIAQNDITKLEELWLSATSKDIFQFPSPSQIGNLIFGHKLGLLDTSPLEKLLWNEVDLNKLLSSSIKAGWCTTDLCSLETKLFTTDDVTSKKHLIEILMASASIPIAFPPQQINGEGLWVDGGIVKNTPLENAIQLGCDEIFLILLNAQASNECPTNIFRLMGRCFDVVLEASARREIEMTNLYNRLLEKPYIKSKTKKKVVIHIIQPKSNVTTGLLEIDPARSKKLIEIGYSEANMILDEINQG